jgi:hypothetical protein
MDRHRDRLLALRARSRDTFLNELFVNHGEIRVQGARKDIWRSELFERVPVTLQRSGIVQALRTIQPSPWYVIAQTDFDESRVDPSKIIEFSHVAGIIAVTDDLKGAYLEHEGKNASWVTGTAKRILGRPGVYRT